MPVQVDPLIGRILNGTIRIVRRIGEGGMGYVYEGVQEHLGRKVAIKVMTPEHAQNPVAAEYFLREAQSSSRIRHPNVIQIIDYGKQDELLFMAMEFIPGCPLSDLIEDEFPLNTKRITTIMMQALSGLEEAHAHDLVHRDLKPDNLMIEKTRAGLDFVKVLDFGIAHLHGTDAKPGSLTQQGALLGTPQYMSPEQACGEKVDGRSDLFSMGIILYEMLTQQQPFKGENLPKLLMNIIAQEVVAPSAVRNDVDIPPSLEAICLRALQKEKELRYQTATEFRLAIKEVHATGSFQQVKKQAQPARFIFKRNKPKAASARESPATEQGVVPDSFKTHDTQPEKDSHVIDVQSLLANPILTPDQGVPAVEQITQRASKPTSQDLSLANTMAAWSPDAPETLQNKDDTAKRTTQAFQGLSASIREDLMGHNLKVVALVVHQRTNRAIDPEELMDYYDILEHIALEVAEAWEGVVQSRQGGFTTLIFGMPTMRRDDVFRAGQALLDYRQRLRHQNLDGFTFGFAMAQGDVYAPPNRPLSQIAGQPIEQASAQSRNAGDDEIAVCGESLQDQLSDSFQLGALTRDGHRALIEALDTDIQHTSKSDQLAGREREIAELLAPLGRLSRKQGALVSIIGTGGVGKTALIQEAKHLAEQRQFFTLQARQRSAGAAGMLDVLKQLLRDYLRQTGLSPNQLAQQAHEIGTPAEYSRMLQGFLTDTLQDVFSYKGKARSARQEISATQSIQASIRQFLLALVTQKPLAIFIDGIDPYDKHLSQFVVKSLSAIQTNAIMLCLGIRTYPGQNQLELPTQTTIIEVAPLSEAICQAYLKLKTPTLAESLRRKIVRLSAGNPLQLNQLIAFVLAKPDALPHELEASFQQLKGVSTLLRLQLQRQPKHVQNILGLMAVLGDGVSADAVADLALVDWSYNEALQFAYDKGLIFVEEHEDVARLSFENPLFEQVIYKSMPRRGREKTHKRAAQYFYKRLQKGSDTQKEDKLALIRHLEAAKAFDDAIRLTESVVQEMMITFDYEQAEALLKRTLRLREEAKDQPPNRLAELKLMLARLLDRQGRTKEALALVLKLNRQTDLTQQLTHEIRLEISALWLEEEDPILIEKMLKRIIKSTYQALSVSQNEQDLWMHIRAQQMLSVVYEKQNKPLLAMDNLLAVVDLIERNNINPLTNPWGPSLVWEPLNQLGRLQIKNQAFEQAMAMFKLGLEVVKESQDLYGEVTINANISAMYIIQEKFDLGLKALAKAIRLAKNTGQMRTLAKLHHNKALVYIRQHNPSLAKETLEESQSICMALDWREGLAMNANLLRRLEQQ